MAHLQQLIDVSNTLKEYNLKNLIETGTGAGETLSFVRLLDLDLIQSCEIEKIHLLILISNCGMEIRQQC